MSNISLEDALYRFWQHFIAKIGTKADLDLNNIDNEILKTKIEASGFIGGSQVQINTWEEED